MENESIKEPVAGEVAGMVTESVSAPVKRVSALKGRKRPPEFAARIKEIAAARKLDGRGWGRKAKKRSVVQVLQEEVVQASQTS